MGKIWQPFENVILHFRKLFFFIFPLLRNRVRDIQFSASMKATK